MTCELEVENASANVKMHRALRDYMEKSGIGEKEAIGLSSCVMNHGGYLLKDAMRYRGYVVMPYHRQQNADYVWEYLGKGYNATCTDLREALHEIDTLEDGE